MFRLDALVILRAKVKQGAKMLVLYRHGSFTCAPMRFGAHVVQYRQQGERYGGDEEERLQREDKRDALRHHYLQEATKGPHCHPGSQDSSFTATAAQQRENNKEHIQ